MSSMFQDYNPNTPIAAAWLNRVDDLLEGLPTGTGAAGIGWQSPLNGSVLRTLQAKAQDTVHVRDFGVVGDNITDDTVALQLALTNLPNNTKLDFTGCLCRVTSPVTLLGKTQVMLMGAGGIRRDYGTANTRCMIVKSCTNVGFAGGLSFIGGNTASTASVGEDDLLVIGDPVTTNPDTFNHAIEIAGCFFSGGAHGGINVYGNFGSSAVVKNFDIHIHHNDFDSCTWGWWVYKNGRRVTAEFNNVTNAGNGGFVADTLAQGDTSRSVTEPSYDLYFNNNIVDTVGLVAGAGARGGLIKGNVTGFSMSGNVFRRVGTVASAADSFGWLVGTDFANGAPSQGEVNNNTVDTVISAGSGFIGAVSRGASDVEIDNTIGSNSPSGILVEGANRCSLRNSLLSNIYSGFPIYVGSTGSNGLTTTFSGIVAGNQITKSASNANAAIVVGAATTRCHIGVNEVETFSGVGRLFINASATGVSGERYVSAYVAVAYDPPSVPNNATDAAVVNTLVGAVMGDEISVAFSLDMAGCTYQGYMTGPGAAKIVLTNNTGAAVNLGAGTVYVTAQRNTLQP